MKIVTFCAHQPYLYLFSGMGLNMDVIQLRQQQRFLQNWSDKVRPLPSGWRLITWEKARENLGKGTYHLALAHNITDYIDFLPFRLPKIIVIHTTLSGRLKEEKTNINPARYKADFFRLIRKTKGIVVFVSQHKKEDWGLPGAVIPLVVDGNDYQGYSGTLPRILRVSNQLIERGEILDYPAHCRLTAGYELTLIGHNPKVPGARTASDWEELKGFYRNHRVYLHTAKVGQEDGYNTAMLEAMGTGMPVVCTEHPTSPVVDGYNGFVSSDLGYLREKIDLLLHDRELARELGANSRLTVLESFHIQRFQKQWRRVFEKAGKNGH